MEFYSVVYYRNDKDGKWYAFLIPSSIVSDELKNQVSKLEDDFNYIKDIIIGLNDRAVN